MKNSEQPAFPISEEETDRIDGGIKIYTGLSKREYFAAMAMQGLLTLYDSSDYTVPNTSNISHIAKISVIAADCLLKALEKKPNT